MGIIPVMIPVNAGVPLKFSRCAFATLFIQPEVGMKKPFTWAVAAGAVTLLLSIILILVLPSAADVPAMPDGMVTPVVAFEFARSTQDLRMIFGENPAQRTALAARFDAGNILDYAYMITYSALMFFFAAGLRRRRPGLLTNMLPFLAVLVLCADAFENVQLLMITSRLDGDVSGLLLRLQIFTWLKWGGLALYFAMAARPLWLIKGVAARMLAVCGMATLLLAAAAFAHRSLLNELLALFVGLDFILLLVLSWRMREKTAAVS
jgi:hypothetical protein